MLALILNAVLSTQHSVIIQHYKTHQKQEIKFIIESKQSKDPEAEMTQVLKLLGRVFNYKIIMMKM